MKLKWQKSVEWTSSDDRFVIKEAKNKVYKYALFDNLTGYIWGGENLKKLKNAAQDMYSSIIRK